MIWPLFILIFSFQCNVLVRAAPTLAGTYSTTGLESSAIDLFPNASTAGIIELPSPSNTTAPSHAAGRRVPGTSTFLVIAVSNRPIPRFKLGRTILRTQAELRDFINRHDANDTSLAFSDNPYESNPYWEGCYFGVTEYPEGTKMMTYGIVYNVLEGLRLWLYMDRVEKAAVFEVRDEQFGAIGVGRINTFPPKPIVAGADVASTWKGGIDVAGEDGFIGYCERLSHGGCK